MLSPPLGNMCQPTLGGPLNNGLSQEQVVVTSTLRGGCALMAVEHMCVCESKCEGEAGLSAIWSTETIPGEAET